MEKEAVVDLVRRLKLRDHAIMFYEYAEDKYRVLSEYLKAGLDSHEATVYVAGIDETPKQVESFLEKHGIDVDAYQKKEMLLIMSYQDWYLPRGEFSVERTITSWSGLLRDALAKGFKGLRVMGDVTWFLTLGMKEDLLKYENSLHRVLDIPLLAICAFSLPVLMRYNQVQLTVDLIKAHSNVIFLGPLAGLIKTEEMSSVSR